MFFLLNKTKLGLMALYAVLPHLSIRILYILLFFYKDYRTTVCDFLLFFLLAITYYIFSSCIASFLINRIVVKSSFCLRIGFALILQYFFCCVALILSIPLLLIINLSDGETIYIILHILMGPAFPFSYDYS